MQANPDPDPIRKAHAIAQLAAALPVLVEQLEKRPADQGLTVKRAGAIDKSISNIHEVFAGQVEALSASPDLDPIKRARAVARLASEELRLRALRSRRAPEVLPRFDLGAFLEEMHKKRQPEFERRKRRLLKESEEALAETFADEPSGSPGGGAAGS